MGVLGLNEYKAGGEDIGDVDFVSRANVRQID